MAMETRRVAVLMDLQSTPMEMICKSAIADYPVDYIAAGAAGAAEIVMVETGGSNESQKVADLRKSHPSALIIGVGRSIAGDLYDSVVDMPVEAAQLRNRISDLLG